MLKAVEEEQRQQVVLEHDDLNKKEDSQLHAEVDQEAEIDEGAEVNDDAEVHWKVLPEHIVEVLDGDATVNLVFACKPEHFEGQEEAFKEVMVHDIVTAIGALREKVCSCT